MKGWKVKPLTLFFLFLTILFLFIAPTILPMKLKEFEVVDSQTPERPEWTGVISLWDVPYVQTGKGNYIRWLSNYIHNFEKRFPGVFIDVRTMTAERLAMYLHGDDQGILPEIVSLGIYEQQVPEDSLLDMLPFFQTSELIKLHAIAAERVMNNDKMIGVPWMMGSYGLIVNNAQIQNTNIVIDEVSLDYKTLDTLANAMSYEKKSGRKTIEYFGFCSYTTPNSKPILGMIYQDDGKILNDPGYQLINNWNQSGNIFPQDLINLSYSKAFSLLAVEKRAGIMLGSSKVIFDIRKLQESGKGIDFSVYPIPMEGKSELYQDQIAAFGILKDESIEKTQLCVLFLKGLLDEKNQHGLVELGMFPVIQTNSLYEEDDAMKILEESNKDISIGPFGNNKAIVNEFWTNYMK